MIILKLCILALFIFKMHSNFINLQEDKTFHKHKFKIQNDKSRVFSFTDRESQVCEKLG